MPTDQCCVREAMLVAFCIIFAAYILYTPASWFDGYWRTGDGKLFGIKTTGGRSLLITGLKRDAVQGHLSFARRICVGGECAFLSLDRRTLVWPTIGVWYRQGVF